MAAHLRYACLIGLLSLLPTLVLAEKPADTQALAGVETGKVAWDINMGDAKKLRLYLQVMAETYDDLKRQGVEPDMVFTFRGPSLPLISSEHADVPLDEIEHYEAVAEQIAALQQKPGVRMEACSIAARLFGVEAETLLPGIDFVGNTFVSQIGYQSKGYASIPIF
ncbi:DsrE family protein [Thiohalocapsa marina]|uniref:DsrE family protein n=1 Tax=Thiohalocapsa marina TaxID=424902 RepID=A0A5M8FJV8_9GAMM|nr:DsrE family protein [Thiohalocapsa marina]KAA6184006.1 DsrE family protein [Thiohalocapsa marina]